MTDGRSQDLCRSIEADREFLWRRPVLAQADGTIYAGHMRYRAAQHLGMEAIPAIIEDVSDQLAQERIWSADEPPRHLPDLAGRGGVVSRSATAG
jgi:ParB-like chromosome segregation protein Spo0J